MAKKINLSRPAAPPAAQPLDEPAVNRADFSEIMALIREASIPREFPPETLYRCAGFGALALFDDALMTGDSSGAEALIETVLVSPSEPIRKRAVQILTSRAKSGSTLATEALFTLAIDELRSELLPVLRENRFISIRAPYEAGKLLFLNEAKKLRTFDPTLSNLTDLFRSGSVAVRDALLSSAEKTLSGWRALAAWLIAPNDPKARVALVKAYPSLSPEERACFFAQTADTSEATGNLLADLYLSQEDERVRERCVERNARPSDPRDDAIYYFLIENWERYRESDVDYRAILRVFDGPDKSLQLRLLTIGAKSGENGWIAALNPDDRLISSPSVFSPDDWLEQMKTYAQCSDWEKLWQLTLNAPIALTRQALTRLASAKFKPANPEESALYRHAQSFIPDNELPIPPRPLAAVQHVAGPISSARFSFNGAFLSVVSVSGKLLALRTAEPANPILRVELSNAVPRHAEFTNDGKYLVSSWSDKTFRVFNTATGALTQQFPTPGANLITFRVRADDRRLLLVESDGTVREVSFPTGVELYQEAAFPNRRVTHATYDEAKGRLLLVGEDGGAVLFDLNRKIPIAKMRLSTPILSFSDTIIGDWLVYGSGSRLILTHVPTGNCLFDETISEDDNARMISLNFDPETGCVFALLSDGRCLTLSAPSGIKLAEADALPETARPLTVGSVNFPGRVIALFDDSGRLTLCSLSDWRLSLLPTDRVEPDELSLSGGDPLFRSFMTQRVEYQRRFEIDLDLDEDEFGS